ncbi:MAG: helix-turn-helix domain-containing protein, partial [Bacteroidetes bacterium]|nr:helix-turn-helix domain-containing protein [Bacteroidota bacterium]
MADPEQVRKAGRRLATDLRDLREARQVTSESIIEATRLTADVFKGFDESALVDHPAFNRVYLRSVMASYARVLEIDEGLAFRALEEALDGTYAGGLKRVYIQGLSVDEWSEPSTEGDKEPVDETEKVVASSREPTELDDELEEAQLSRLSTWFNSRRALPIGILIIVISVIVILINRSSIGEQDALTVQTTIEPVPPPEPEWIILGDSIRFDIIATT